ncbi:hypothetical protein TSUD_325070 [Trifolium subterraneum]|uniref:Condensation domain-containing protein n=1 Tax=Trifolium subterraneum TaxID=3900 RepID=A0A2Z6PP72_TRISU|nr:hypothetical protein TSUD_325070 [Trifolium subterraneum]
MYASTYVTDEKRFAVSLQFHLSAFDHATTVTLLKELLRLIAGRCGGDDGGGAKSDEKVDLANEDGDNVNLYCGFAQRNIDFN